MVVIDEAHDIQSHEVFEELRLMLNFQTETRFLLTLLLVGQPELDSLLEANRQFSQRVDLRFHLGPFDLHDTELYIRHRLRVASVEDSVVFPPETIALVHRHSGGIPRWINHFCHLSLLSAASRNIRTVTTDIVTDAIRTAKGSS